MRGSVVLDVVVVISFMLFLVSILKTNYYLYYGMFELGKSGYHGQVLYARTKNEKVVRKAVDTVSYDKFDKPIYRDECVKEGRVRETKALLLVGIPTMLRVYKNKTAFYLSRTLDAFIKPLSIQQRNRIHFAIFVTDTNLDKRQQIVDRTKKSYHRELDEGLITIVTIPGRFYSNLHHLPRTFGDGESRVYWKAKQALDYAFIFNYAYELCEYYMQTEDDALPNGNYFDIITRDISLAGDHSIRHNKRLPWGHNMTSWLSLQYFNTGFIGVVFPAHNLPFMSVMVKTFYWSTPVDLVFRHLGVTYGYVLYQMGDIFTHIGEQSSSLGT